MDGITPEAVEEVDTAPAFREPVLKGEREENPQVFMMQEKKHDKEQVHSRRGDFGSQVQRTTFKEDRGQGTGP